MCLSLQLNSLLEIFSSRPRAEQGWRERLSIDAGLNKVLTGLTKNSREYLSTGNGRNKLFASGFNGRLLPTSVGYPGLQMWWLGSHQLSPRKVAASDWAQTCNLRLGD